MQSCKAGSISKYVRAADIKCIMKTKHRSAMRSRCNMKMVKRRRNIRHLADELRQREV